MSKNILCVDIGTSSLKTALIDDEGTIISYSRQPFLFRYTNHAADEWLTALRSAATELFASQSFSFESIDAVCISGNGPTLVADTGDTLSWSIPVEQKGESLFISRILDFKQRFKLAWAFSKHIFSGPEYLIWLLTDKCVTILPEERYINAYWTEDKLLKEGLTIQEIEKFPSFVAPGTMAGTISPKIAALLSASIPTISTKVPVYCGAPDFIAAMIGTNTLHNGALCDRAGSSEGINLCTDKPVTGSKIRTLPSIIPGLWNASYLISDSGTKFAAYKQKIERIRGRKVDNEEFVKELVQLDSIIGEPTLLHGKKLIEEIALEVKSGIEILLSTAHINNNKEITMAVTGGQAANDAWNQLKADIAGIKITLPACTDSELIGDAALALNGMGVFRTITEAAEKLYNSSKTYFPKEIRLED